MKNNFKFLVAAFAIVAVSVTTASAAYTHSTTLKMGSRSTQVMALQQTLNMTDCKVAASGAGSKGMETTYFGPATKAAVQCFQRVNALGADGVVGAMTGAKLSAIVVTDSTLPAGCSSTTGYSTTTGIKCDTTTGTGTTTPTNPGNLQGGAGDLDLSDTSTDVEDTVEEGNTEKVLGMEAEANDSDIAITNVKVEIEATGGTGSTRIEKYLDSVSIWLGDKKVGSVDADEFNKDGTTYSKSISLSSAVIEEDETENLYVAVEALSSVDDTSKEFTVEITDVRYTDATGAILSASLTNVDTTEFSFDDEGAEDGLSIKSSSSNPDASTLKVDDNSKSDDFKVLVFKLEADDDGADIDVLEAPVVIELSSGTIASTVSEVYVKVGSTKYTAKRDGAGAGTTSTFDVDFKDNFTVDAGDQEEVEVYVVFNKQDGNYADGVTVKASVAGSGIEAEGADEVTVSGNGTGKVHTLSLASATIDGHKWETTKSDTAAVIDFFFTVESDDEDFDVLSSSIMDGASTGTLSLVTGDATTNSAGVSYTVESGDTATFRVRYNFSGAGSYEVKITSAAGVEVPQNKQLSPTVVLQS